MVQKKVLFKKRKLFFQIAEFYSNVQKDTQFLSYIPFPFRQLKIFKSDHSFTLGNFPKAAAQGLRKNFGLTMWFPRNTNSVHPQIVIHCLNCDEVSLAVCTFISTLAEEHIINFFHFPAGTTRVMVRIVFFVCFATIFLYMAHETPYFGRGRKCRTKKR